MLAWIIIKIMLVYIIIIILAWIIIKIMPVKWIIKIIIIWKFPKGILIKIKVQMKMKKNLTCLIKNLISYLLYNKSMKKVLIYYKIIVTRKLIKNKILMISVRFKYKIIIRVKY
jgi:hypothetical protein